MTETLDIVVFATGDYIKTFDRFFKPSLPTDVDRVYVVTHEEVALPGQTDSDIYKEKMAMRLEIYLEYIQRNRGKKMLFLDCDIVFFKSFKNDFLTLLDSNDMFIQKDHIGGIIGVKCDQIVEDFFEYLVKKCKETPLGERKDGYPQWQLNETIAEFTNNRDFQLVELPEKYGFLTDDMVMYHAINGGQCVEHKNEILYFVHGWVTRAFETGPNAELSEHWDKMMKDGSEEEKKHVTYAGASDPTEESPEGAVILWPSWNTSADMWEKYYNSEKKKEVLEMIKGFVREAHELPDDFKNWKGYAVFAGYGINEFTSMSPNTPPDVEKTIRNRSKYVGQLDGTGIDAS